MTLHLQDPEGDAHILCPRCLPHLPVLMTQGHVYPWDFLCHRLPATYDWQRWMYKTTLLIKNWTKHEKMTPSIDPWGLACRASPYRVSFLSDLHSKNWASIKYDHVTYFGQWNMSSSVCHFKLEPIMALPHQCSNQQCFRWCHCLDPEWEMWTEDPCWQECMWRNPGMGW
jgi:hypothetical protein